MPSSNQRSSSERPSRNTANRIERHAYRESSVPHRDFIFILTNNPDLLRHTRSFQPLIVPQNNNTRDPQNENQREQALNAILSIELQEVAQNYLSRTREQYPIYYVFNGSGSEQQQRQS